jgi:hypothetical protein
MRTCKSPTPLVRMNTIQHTPSHGETEVHLRFLVDQVLTLQYMSIKIRNQPTHSVILTSFILTNLVSLYVQRHSPVLS